MPECLQARYEVLALDSVSSGFKYTKERSLGT